MYVTWNGNTGCLGVLKEERETKIEQAILLVSFARPHHKKVNELFSWDPSERCNNSVWSIGSGDKATSRPPLPREMDDTDGKRTRTSCLNMNNRFVSVWQADSPAPSCLSTVVISVPCLSIQQRGNLLPPFVGGRLPVKTQVLASGCGARTHWKDAI